MVGSIVLLLSQRKSRTTLKRKSLAKPCQEPASTPAPLQYRRGKWDPIQYHLTSNSVAIFNWCWERWKVVFGVDVLSQHAAHSIYKNENDRDKVLMWLQIQLQYTIMIVFGTWSVWIRGRQTLHEKANVGMRPYGWWEQEWRKVEMNMRRWCRQKAPNEKVGASVPFPPSTKHTHSHVQSLRSLERATSGHPHMKRKIKTDRERRERKK